MSELREKPIRKEFNYLLQLYVGNPIKRFNQSIEIKRSKHNAKAVWVINNRKKPERKQSGQSVFFANYLFFLANIILVIINSGIS